MACSLVFCDGVDSTGKSTTCEILVNNVIPKQKFCKASKVILPSGEGPLGFIRSYVKNKDFQCDDFSRQLLHCCDNIHSFCSFAYGDHISYRGRKFRHYYIFDRGPLSTMVYGQALIKNPVYLQILRDININVLQDLIEKEMIDDLVFVLMNKDKPYKSPDDSYYEQMTNFENIKKLYMENFDKLKNSEIAKSKRVKFCSVHVDDGLSKEEVAQKVWESINQ